MVKTVNLVIGILSLIIGAFYAFIPHTTHISSGFGFGLSHGTHVLLGLILLVIGIALLLLSKK